MKNLSIFIFLAILLVSCVPDSMVVPSNTFTDTLESTTIPFSTANNIPLPTTEPTPTFTPTLTRTPKPTSTPIPIFLLGSPFGACGNGEAIIWSNDSYNGPVPSKYDSKMDQHHGHVDIMRPGECSEITVYSPADGYLIKVGNNNYDLILDIGLKLGINPDNPSEFAGKLEKILFSSGSNQIVLKLAHFSSTVSDGYVKKGDEIGELVMESNQWKIAYQITTTYGNYQIWSPTLFLWDKQPICANNSTYDCIPEVNDYAP